MTVPWVETRKESQVQARVGKPGRKRKRKKRKREAEGREEKGKLKLEEDEEKGQNDRRKGSD